MVKKDTLVIIASVLLFVILAALLFLEMKNPEGGMELMAGLLGHISGN